jgi:23S rRNA (adenine1618-N6)-methyltransferase
MKRPPSKPATAAPPPGPHPRNRHRGHYDLPRLVEACPELGRHLVTTPAGERSIDFGHPDAVRLLNRSLLATQYGIQHWDLPPGYLCPPVPGRADYLHGLADLLAADHGGEIPRGAAIRALDIGVGASVIYPLLGHAEYGWHFVGSDIDPQALAAAAAIVRANGLDAAIALRRQADRGRILAGLLGPGERFALSLCNPPFHASAAEAGRGNARKWQNLGGNHRAAPLNFGGHANELWCAGGEAGFLRRMIEESAACATQVGWFSSLVSRREHVAPVRARLQKLRAQDVRVVAMAQGNKQSRFLAWSFLDAAQRVALCDTPSP